MLGVVGDIGSLGWLEGWGGEAYPFVYVPSSSHNQGSSGQCFGPTEVNDDFDVFHFDYLVID